jgi:hypothetical protein
MPKDLALLSLGALNLGCATEYELEVKTGVL